MIISRYLAKEVMYTMIAVTAIVVFIFICNQFVHYLHYVANGQFAANMLIYIVLLQVPLLFGMLLPLGFFLGILLGYGRLYADSEMTVLSACGFSRKQLLATTMKFAVVVAIIVALLVMWVGPIVARQRDLMMDIAESSSIFQTIMPGHFQSSMSGKRVFYVQHMASDRSHMQNVFLSQQLSHKPDNLTSGVHDWMVISSKGGYQMTDPKTGDEFMVATNGYRYEGVPGQRDFKIIKFAKYGVRINSPTAVGKHSGEETLTMHKLIQQAKDKPDYMAELQWRVSFPITVFILALLAVPLSRVNPRHGRFAQLIPAVLIYIVYANMIFVCRDWLEAGTIPGWIGIWWVHILAFVLALYLIARQAGYRIFKRRK